MKHSNRVPLWLRRLDQVKAELKSVRFPRTAEERFRQCAMLSAIALRLLRESIRTVHPGASEGQIEMEMRRLLARFAQADARWVAKWRKGVSAPLGASLSGVLRRVTSKGT